MKYFVTIGEREHEVELIERLGELHVRVNGAPLDLTYEEVDRHGQVMLLHEGKTYGMSMEGDGNRVGVTLAGQFYDLGIEDERERAAHLAERERSKGGGVVKAVMPGIVVELLVEPGDVVQQGQPLLILEAMKMQNEISAPGDGVVEVLHVAAGTTVAMGTALVTLSEPPA